jgi:hypothetical protein
MRKWNKEAKINRQKMKLKNKKALNLRITIYLKENLYSFSTRIVL